MNLSRSYVTFGRDKLIFGVAAKKYQPKNIGSTVVDFKKMLCKNLEHFLLEIYDLQYGHYNGYGIHVNYTGERQILTPKKIISMFFEMIKEICEKSLERSIKDCVITVPPYFRTNQRSALIDAVQNVGLNIIQLLNETTAVALLYGLSRADWPPCEEKPPNFAIVNAGKTEVQVGIYAYDHGQLRMVNYAYKIIGDQNFDEQIYRNIAHELRHKYGQMGKFTDRSTEAFLLLAEIEKQKNKMSVDGSDMTLELGRFF